jgi:hypothetical protein
VNRRTLEGESAETIVARVQDVLHDLPAERIYLNRDAVARTARIPIIDVRRKYPPSLGFNLTFFPQFILGSLGMPSTRRPSKAASRLTARGKHHVEAAGVRIRRLRT